MSDRHDLATKHAKAFQARADSRLALRFVRWLISCRPALASGLLLWLSFPPVGWSWLAWFALVPLLTLVRRPWRERAVYGPATAGGLVFGLLAVQWIRYADDSGLSGYYGWWALAAYMALYFPLCLSVLRIASLRFQVPLILAVPIAWVGLEYLRSWFLTGFAWYFLSHTQYRLPTLIQISDLAGAYGVSFVVALVNGWIVDLLAVPLFRPGAARPRVATEQVWRLAIVVGVLACTIAYGLHRHVEFVGEDGGPPVSLIQTNIAQHIKADSDKLPEINRHYERLIAETNGWDSVLTVWPETAYRLHLVVIDPDVSDDDLRRHYPDDKFDPTMIREYAHDVRVDLVRRMTRGQTPALVGVNFEHVSKSRVRIFNSAVLVSPGGAISEPYHKIHLVPWGEYLPLRDWMPWLHIFTPHASSDYGLAAGTSRVRFPWWDDRTLGVLICFEDTVPWAARELMREQPVDLLVNISNDGWFGVTDDDDDRPSLWQRAEHEAHLAISVFRAVECRRPMVRAVNTGVSAFISPNGVIESATGRGDCQSGLASAVLKSNVHDDHRESLYVRTGDWLGVACLVASAGALLGGIASALRRRERR